VPRFLLIGPPSSTYPSASPWMTLLTASDRRRFL